MSIEDAIENLVEDGDLIGIGGLSFWRKPMSACRQLIKQNKRDLSEWRSLEWLLTIEKQLNRVKLE
ncbi:MAG: hypothetical protein ACTSRH_14485 [Promethearchaeota archaeon]